MGEGISGIGGLVDKLKDVAGDSLDGKAGGMAEELVESLTGKDLDNDGSVGTKETAKAAQAAKVVADKLPENAKDILGNAAGILGGKLK